MPYPRFSRARNFKFARRVSSDIAITSTTWANVDTGLDITLDAQSGDVIEYGIIGFWDSQAFIGSLEVSTVVSGSVVNAFSENGAENSTHNGVVGWLALSGIYTPLSGSIMYTLQTGDISSGTTTLRLRGKIGATGSRTLFSSATNPMQVWAKNLGPVDPN